MKRIHLIVAALVLAASVSAYAAPKVILYFTAGRWPTTQEQAEIAKLNTLNSQPYQVRVVNSQIAAKYGSRQITADYVAGSVPAAFHTDGVLDAGTLYPVLDPAAPPRYPGLPAGQAVVNNGGTVTTDAGTYTFTVRDGSVLVITGPS